MDYDRALYRVYEKTIDDITTSRRNRQSRSSEINRNRNTNTTNTTSNADLFTASSFDQTSNRRRNESYIPFFLPNKLNNDFGLHYLNPCTRFYGCRLVRQKFRLRMLSLRNFGRSSNSSNNSSTTSLSNSSHDSPNNDDSPNSPSSSSGGLRRRPITPRRILSEFEPLSTSQSSLSSSHDVEQSDSYQEQVELITVRSSQSDLNGTIQAEVEQQPNNSNDVVLEEEEETESNDTNDNSNNNNNNNMLCGGFTEFALIFCMRLAMFLALIHFIILFVLHSTYVGPQVSKPVQEKRDDGSSMTTLISTTCLEKALATRPIAERSDYQPDLNPLFGHDELLQIKIIEDECEEDAADEEIEGGRYSCSKVRELNSRKSIEQLRAILPSAPIRELDPFSKEMKEWTYGSDVYWSTPNFRFATDKALLELENDLLYHYKVSIVNVTLSSRCLSTGSDDNDGTLNRLGRFLLSSFYGYETAVINQLMYGIKTHDGSYRDGYVWNMKTGEHFNYSKVEILSHVQKLGNPYLKLITKLGILVLSITCYFFTSSVTAIIVRTLTSSGVLILFPFFSLLEMFGTMMIDEGVMDYAHPWLGTARRRIQNRGIYPFSHFVLGHMGKLTLSYSMYEACQLAWTSVFYTMIPTAFPLWSFGFLLLIEYFSLLHVRSAAR